MYSNARSLTVIEWVHKNQTVKEQGDSKLKIFKLMTSVKCFFDQKHYNIN